ncbi:S24 family peptidase [uncultured Photobacterium sp.]|uniref:S24 family peptidase n=1 Tax=uncultured Photobacterium sp. TaxID=173973 RepID=UPI00262A5C6A|nr:S24 family peptidase [uncultured Photobacterium sp.]
MSGFTGFENPTKPYLENNLDLGELIHHPAATFVYIKSDTDNCGLIGSSDWVIIDAALTPEAKDLVLVEQFGEQAVIPLSRINALDSELQVIGVAVAIIRFHQNPLPVPTGNLQASLHRLLLPSSETSFIAVAQGNRMMPFGIHNGSLTVVERHVDYKDGDIAIVYHQNQFACRQLNLSAGTLDDGVGKQVPITRPFAVEGVVTKTILQLRHLVS